MVRRRKKTDKRSDKKEPAKDVKEFSNSIVYKEMDIHRELFQEYFKFQAPSFMLKDKIITYEM